jgi:hypothetical protein
MIGDRRFASIVQKFLHEYMEIKIVYIEIVAPYEDPDGHPRVRAWQNKRPLRFEMAETQMPTNIKSFQLLELRFAHPYFWLYKLPDCYFGKLNLIMGPLCITLSSLDTLTFVASPLTGLLLII